MRIHSIQRWLILLTALAGFFLPSASVRAADLPKGWSATTVGELSFGMPSSWKTIELTKAALETVTDAAKKDNPELARVLQNLIDTGQYKLLRFFAIDPISRYNLNVALVPLGAQLKPKAIVDVLAPQIIQNLPNTTLVEIKSDLVLNGIPAARIAYDIPITGANGKAAILRGYQYYVPVDTNLYVMSITGTLSKPFSSLTEQIASTLQLAKSQPASENSVTVKSSGNVRGAPTTSAKIIDKITAKEQLLVLGRNKAGTWLKITTPRGKTGWVSTALVSITKAKLNLLKVVS